MSDRTDLRLLLTAADLLTGTEELARYAKHGLPRVLTATCEPPDIVLRRVLATVGPRDLPGGFGPLWGACAALWGVGKTATLEQGALQVEDHDGLSAASALRFCHDHGMGVAYMAPIAAERLLRYAVGSATYAEARQAAARALDGRRMALHGVV